MKKRICELLGVIGPLLIYITIIFSVILSPWFNWETNTLSDLGNSLHSEVAPLFNVGLLLAGFFLMIYSLTVFKKHAKYSSYCLLVSTFFIQLLATFNEAYGFLHYVVAIPHFVILSITSIVYTLEKSSSFAITTFLIVMISWFIYFSKIIEIGIAIPETLSKLVLLWIMFSSIKIYLAKESISKQ
jgi:hypothetical membrane protein